MAGMFFWWRQPKRLSDERLIRAAEILARTLDSDEDQQVVALKKEGFEEGEAHRLAALLPLAFSRPILEALGIKDFVPLVTAGDAEGTQVEASLMRQPEYVAGLKIARKHMRHGVLDHEIYKRIAGSSADLAAVSSALDAGQDIRGATIASALLWPNVARYLIR